MNERDERLRILVEAVRQQPKRSLSWRKAMNQLLIEIQQLPGLAKSSHPDYVEALDDTLMKLSEEIGEFEPMKPSLEESLVNWINLKLRLRYRVRGLHSQQLPLSLDVPISEAGGETFASQLPDERASTVWEIEAEIRQEQEQQKNVRIGVRLKQYIEQDPEKKLRLCHPRAHPHCNCQVLSQRLLLKHPPDKLVDLARDLNVKYHTLNWHWKNKGLPLLQTIAKNLGYQSEAEL